MCGAHTIAKMANSLADLPTHVRRNFMKKFITLQSEEYHGKWVAPWNHIGRVLKWLPWSFVAGALPSYIAGVTKDIISTPTIFAPLSDDEDFTNRMQCLIDERAAFWDTPQEVFSRCWQSRNKCGVNLQVYFIRVPIEHMGSQEDAIMHTIGRMDVRINRYWMRPYEDGKVMHVDDNDAMCVIVVDCSGDRVAAQKQIYKLYYNTFFERGGNDSYFWGWKMFKSCRNMRKVYRPSISLMGISMGKLLDVDAKGETDLSFFTYSTTSNFQSEYLTEKDGLCV